MTETPNQTMARLMRETADLIERGFISSWEVDIEFGHRREPDPKTGGYTMRMVSTGQRTVRIELYGHDWHHADWTRARSPQTAIGSDRKLLR